MLSSSRLSIWITAAGICIVAALVVIRLKSANVSPGGEVGTIQKGSNPVHASSVRGRTKADQPGPIVTSTVLAPSAGYTFPGDETKPALITKMKHPENIESITNAASAALKEIRSILEGKYDQVREWNRRYFLNLTNQEQNVALLCTFYTPTGGLKQVDRVSLGPAQNRSLMTFYTNGGIKLFEQPHGAEGVKFYEDGKVEYFYSRLPDGREYSVEWDKAGQVTYERTR